MSGSLPPLPEIPEMDRRNSVFISNHPKPQRSESYNFGTDNSDQTNGYMPPRSSHFAKLKKTRAKIPAEVNTSEHKKPITKRIKKKFKESAMSQSRQDFSSDASG